MRYLLREIINTDNIENVELRNMSAKDKLITAILIKYKQSKGYRDKVNKEKEKAELERQETEDKLKDAILYRIHTAFKDSSVNKMSIELSISRVYKDFIDSVITSKEFLGFDIIRKTENPDMLLAFPNLPIMLIVTKKIINEVE